jgi:hypothetical protein
MTRSRVRTFSAVDRDIEMLEAIAAYHGFSKSATIASLIRKEFWRVFPAGTAEIRPDDGAAVADVETAPTRVTRKKKERTT